MPSSMILKPRMSEKTYALSSNGVYVFDVPTDVNKSQIATAVASQFEVTVEDVRVLVAKGKEARSIRLGGIRRQIYGRRPNVKKAYVTLKKGDEIPIFAEVEKAEEEERKAEEKAAKKAAKESAKATTKSKPKAAKPIVEKEPTKPKQKSPAPAKKESFARRFFRRRSN